MGRKLDENFFRGDVLEVAPRLLGKVLVRQFEDGTVRRYRITDVEAYRGEEDRACHASRGRTRRTEMLYAAGGRIYVYLIYGMYWLLNFVTGDEGSPQAVLIRGVENVYGPGRIGRELKLDGSFYGEPACGDRLWIEDSGEEPEYVTAERVGVEYAGEWKSKPWRYMVKK